MTDIGIFLCPVCEAVIAGDVPCPNGPHVFCKIPWCDGEVAARALCAGHYARWWRTGDPLPPARPASRLPASWRRTTG